MRSATDSDDLTTRARIRNAAIELFGRHGFDRTSVRAIAQEAGVSAALVVHHFGDKHGLRVACDAHVVAMIIDEHGLSESPTMESIQAALKDMDTYGPALNYLARMLTEDSAVADDLFDALLRGTRQMMRDQEAAGVIRPSSDPEVTALLLTLFGLAPLVLKRQFVRALGETDLTPASMQRITLPTLELFTHGIYRDEALVQAARDALGQPGNG